MKKRFGFWIVFAIVIMSAIIIVSKNFAAALCIGIGAAMLLATITNLEVIKKIRS